MTAICCAGRLVVYCVLVCLECLSLGCVATCLDEAWQMGTAVSCGLWAELAEDSANRVCFGCIFFLCF